jgi:pyridoxine 5'-phosphate synthase PdxJ
MCSCRPEVCDGACGCGCGHTADPAIKRYLTERIHRERRHIVNELFERLIEEAVRDRVNIENAPYAAGLTKAAEIIKKYEG